MERNINWNDNIKPELNQARDVVAMKAFENAKFLMEREKQLRCVSGDDYFVLALGRKFFKGMAPSAQVQFDKLMEAEGYVAVYLNKKRGLFGVDCYTAYVPRNRYECAMNTYPNDYNQAVRYMTDYSHVAWFK